MTSKKLRRFRHRLVRTLRYSLPEIDGITLGRLANRLERLMIHDAFELTKIVHAPECCCWDCLDALHLNVLHHRCEMLVSREMAAEHD